MIGVFDSGYGGLTILRALVERLPQYSYTYYGDNAHAPYGDMSDDDIIAHTQIGVERLFEYGAELVILGCNTASALALRTIQQNFLPEHYPDKHVLGIVVPTIEQITGAPWIPDHTTIQSTYSKPSNVGVLGTSATIRSNVYVHEIHKRAPSIRIHQQACPSLVSAIEGNKKEDIISKQVEACVANLIAASEPLDAVLLGCTHYELIAPMIRKTLPEKTRLYEQPAIVALSLEKYLNKHHKRESAITRNAELTFYTTGDPNTVSMHGSRYFGSPIQFTLAKHTV